jgi:hypothetical protein
MHFTSAMHEYDYCSTLVITRPFNFLSELCIHLSNCIMSRSTPSDMFSCSDPFYCRLHRDMMVEKYIVRVIPSTTLLCQQNRVAQPFMDIVASDIET